MSFFLRKYGTALVAGTAGSDLVRVSIRTAAGTAFATSSDWTPGAGDVKVSQDGGAEANVATLPSYSNGAWEFTLSATELDTKTTRVRVDDAAVEPFDITIETFGHASANYPTDYSVEQTAAIASALAGTAPLNLYGPITNGTLDLYRGDSYANGDSRGITVTKSSETYWPTTLSNVFAWFRPTAAFRAKNSSAASVPAMLSVSTLARSSTTATATTSTPHGLSTNDVVQIHGATDDQLWNGYYSVTVTSTTAFTYTLASAPTASTATGTITAQQGIACAVTQATGSSQAFRFEPTALQLRGLTTGEQGNRYLFWFIANAATAPATLRTGPVNARPDPGGA